MMTAKLYNSIKFYMLSIHESDELAEAQTQEYVDKFNSLDKHDQMVVDQLVQLDGWEYVIDKIDNLYE
jgi:hypothetical protein